MVEPVRSPVTHSICVESAAVAGPGVGHRPDRQQRAHDFDLTKSGAYLGDTASEPKRVTRVPRIGMVTHPPAGCG